MTHRLGQIIKDLGFHTRLGNVEANDVDLWVYYEGVLILVAEVLNWSLMSELTAPRKECMVKNLQSYSCNRVLIYTCMANENFLEDLHKFNISILKLGYQLQPRYFYNHFAEKNQVELVSFRRGL